MRRVIPLPESESLLAASLDRPDRLMRAIALVRAGWSYTAVSSALEVSRGTLQRAVTATPEIPSTLLNPSIPLPPPRPTRAPKKPRSLSNIPPDLALEFHDLALQARRDPSVRPRANQLVLDLFCHSTAVQIAEAADLPLGLVRSRLRAARAANLNGKTVRAEDMPGEWYLRDSQTAGADGTVSNIEFGGSPVAPILVINPDAAPDPRPFEEQLIEAMATPISPEAETRSAFLHGYPPGHNSADPNGVIVEKYNAEHQENDICAACGLRHVWTAGCRWILDSLKLPIDPDKSYRGEAGSHPFGNSVTGPPGPGLAPAPSDLPDRILCPDCLTLHLAGSCPSPFAQDPNGLVQ